MTSGQRDDEKKPKEGKTPKGNGRYLRQHAQHRPHLSRCVKKQHRGLNHFNHDNRQNRRRGHTNPSGGGKMGGQQIVENVAGKDRAHHKKEKETAHTQKDEADNEICVPHRCASVFNSQTHAQQRHNQRRHRWDEPAQIG